MALKDIETIVVVILENRSFDHMLGYLSLTMADPPMQVEGLRDDQMWLDARTNLYAYQEYSIHSLRPEVQQIDDPPHEQATIALQLNTAPKDPALQKMGGFVVSYMERNPRPQDASLVMGYYTREAVPIFDFFARNFVVCDHWFAALPTGTQANRLMAMSGESSIVDNAPVFLPEQALVYDWLDAHEISWCVYQSGAFLPFFSLMPDWLPEIVTSLTLSDHGGRGRFRRFPRFREHWMSSETMPSIIFLEPEYTDGPVHADPNDDHPPTGIGRGQAFLADIYSTLISNPNRWRNALMIVTYDEHGGFFDHVPPIAISTTVAGFRFETTGVRVPAFIVSPHVPRNSVFDGALDHTSILQLLADRFNPGGDYSAAVGARQPHLARLATVVPEEQPEDTRMSNIPPEALNKIEAVQMAAHPPAKLARAAGATANARAFHNAALKAARDHPELLGTQGWSRLAEYVHKVQGGS